VVGATVEDEYTGCGGGVATPASSCTDAGADPGVPATTGTGAMAITVGEPVATASIVVDEVAATLDAHRGDIVVADPGACTVVEPRTCGTQACRGLVSG
jgi:hypothetical protein